MKKLLLAPLAALAITTTVFGGSYYDEYEYLQNLQEETKEEVVVTAVNSGMATRRSGGGGFTVIGSQPAFGYEDLEFETNLERVLFNQFGPNFDVVLRRGVSLEGVKTAYGDFELQLLKGITLKTSSFTSPDGDFDEEALKFVPNGEYITHYNLGTFIAFRVSGIDLLNEEELMFFNSVTLLLDESENNRFGSSANMLFQDTETGYSYFIAQMHHFLDHLPDALEIDFNITHLVSDPQHRVEEVEVNIPLLLETHSPTFEAPDEELIHFRGGMWSADLEEILGDDFDLNYVYRLVRDEIQIPLGYDNFLSNLALEGNLLHLQFSSPSMSFARNLDFMTNASTWVSLVNTEIEEFDFSLVDFEEIEDLNAFWDNIPQRRLSPLYGVDNSKMEEVEEVVGDETFTFFREASGTRHNEEVFLIEDLSVLGNLAFEISISYMANVVELNLNVEPITSPVIDASVSFEGSFEVNVNGTYYTFEDLNVGFLGVRFDILNAAETLGNWEAPFEERFDPLGDLEIKFILEDGRYVSPTFNSGGWGTGGTMDFETGEWIQGTTLSVDLGGSAIDVENLVSVSINGVVVNIR